MSDFLYGFFAASAFWLSAATILAAWVQAGNDKAARRRKEQVAAGEARYRQLEAEADARDADYRERMSKRPTNIQSIRL